MKPYTLIAAFSAVTLNAAAQHATPSRPDDPSAIVPKVVYQSALKGYTRYVEQAPRSWREVNEEARHTGGHAGIVGGAGHVHGKRPERSTAQSTDAAAAGAAGISDKRATNGPKPGVHRHQGH